MLSMQPPSTFSQCGSDVLLFNCHFAAMFWHFREPVMITEGKMQYLFDEKGRRYLDVSADCTAWTGRYISPGFRVGFNYIRLITASALH
jgi:hypothetical protein